MYNTGFTAHIGLRQCQRHVQTTEPGAAGASAIFCTAINCTLPSHRHESAGTVAAQCNFFSSLFLSIHLFHYLFQVRLTSSLSSPIVGCLRVGHPIAFASIKDGWAKLHPLHYMDLQLDGAMCYTSNFTSHNPLTDGWVILKSEQDEEEFFDVLPPTSFEAVELQKRADLWHAGAPLENQMAMALLSPSSVSSSPSVPAPTPPMLSFESFVVTCTQGHTCQPFTYTKRHNCDLRADPKFSSTCRRQFEVGDEGFRCIACDYDVCLECYGIKTAGARQAAEAADTTCDLLTLLVSMVATLNQTEASSVSPSPSASLPKVRLDVHSFFCSIASAIASGAPRPSDAVAASCSLITAVVPGSSMLSRQALAYLDSALHPDLLPASGTCRIILPDWTIKAALPHQSAIMSLMFAGFPLICMPSFGWADISPSPASAHPLRVSIPAACVLAHMRTLIALPSSSPSSVESLTHATCLPHAVVATAVDELKSMGVLKAASASFNGDSDSYVVLANAWSTEDYIDSNEEPSSCSSQLSTPLSPMAQVDDFPSAPTRRNATSTGFVSSAPYAPPAHSALASSSTTIRHRPPPPESWSYTHVSCLILLLQQRHSRLRVPLVC